MVVHRRAGRREQPEGSVRRLVTVRDLRLTQHYRNRRPPWVKLHRSTLDDDAYARLPASAWRLGLELVLLCSEAEDEVVDASPAALSWRLRRKVSERDVQALLSIGFIIPRQDASGTLAQRERDAASEGETERETETEHTAHSVRRSTAAAGGNGTPEPERFQAWWETYREGITPASDAGSREVRRVLAQGAVDRGAAGPSRRET